MFSIEYARAVHADRLREAADRRRARAVRSDRRSRATTPRWARRWRPVLRRSESRPAPAAGCATC